MARANALTIADWVIPLWSDTRDRVIAVTIGLARGGDTDRAGGVFGQGGPAGDGPGQAAAAYQVWRSKGWDGFPERGSGAAALYWPVAAAAVAERAVQGPVSAVVNAPGQVVQSAQDTANALGGLVGQAQDAFAVAHWLTTPNAWVRIAKVGIGIGLVFIGTLMITFNRTDTPFTKGLEKVDDMLARAPQ